MAAGKWRLYEIAKEALAQGTIDLDSDTFKINLYLSTSNADTLAKATVTANLTSITNQVATNFGYTQDTKAVTITVAESGGTVTVDETTNPVWTASGGDITARFAVIWDDTHATNMPICVCELDTTPADVTATDGNTLTINMSASGLFTMSGADVD
jgi:hypothetical protein